MASLSKRASQARPSATLSLAARARQMAAEGADVVMFTVGEPDFDTPDNVKQAAHRAIQGGFTKYTPAAGIPELRAAIARKLKDDNGLDYAPGQVLVSNGAKQALYMIMLCLLEPGDEVLLPAPYWGSYADQVHACDAETAAIDTTGTGGFRLTPQLLKAVLTDRSRLLVLNSPCNPSGAVLSRAELQALVQVAIERDLWIISDEVYEKLIYDGLQHVSVASLGEEALARTVTINGVSKAYAMTGWRIGYAAGPAEVIRAAADLQSNLAGSPNSPAQKAAVEAISGPQDSVQEMRQAFDERRHALVEGLNRIEEVSCVMPQGAFYAFPDCRGLLGRAYAGRRVDDDVQLCEALLEEAHLAVVPGSAFGTEGFLRFSYATSLATIEEGLERFAGFVGRGGG